MLWIWVFFGSGSDFFLFRRFLDPDPGFFGTGSGGFCIQIQGFLDPGPGFFDPIRGFPDQVVLDPDSRFLYSDPGVFGSGSLDFGSGSFWMRIRGF